MYGKIQQHLLQELETASETGPYRREAAEGRDAVCTAGKGERALCFCSDDYLGLSSDPRLGQAAVHAMQRWEREAAVTRSVRGEGTIHKELERAISDYFGTEETVLYASGFDASIGVFEPLFTEKDAILTDSFCRTAAGDGIRLCKAVRYRYPNGDTERLEEALKLSQAQRFRIIVTDGICPTDGRAAPLERICALAERYDALVLTDESHSAGVIGATGRGITEFCNVRGKADIITGTLGAAFGSSGGFATGRREIVATLRRRSHPYLFSAPLAPSAAGAALEALRLLKENQGPRERLMRNAEHFRRGMKAAGFDIRASESAVCAVLFHDAALTLEMETKLFEEGIRTTALLPPEVPRGQARILVRLSAAHSTEEIDRCIAAFVQAKLAAGATE